MDPYRLGCELAKQAAGLPMPGAAAGGAKPGQPAPGQGLLGPSHQVAMKMAIPATAAKVQAGAIDPSPVPKARSTQAAATQLTNMNQDAKTLNAQNAQANQRGKEQAIQARLAAVPTGSWQPGAALGS